MLNAQSIGNKSTIVSSFIAVSRLDVLLLMESWQTTSDDVVLRLCIPPGYICVAVPRPSQNVAETNHGGVAAIILENSLRLKIITVKLKPKTFESLCFYGSGLGATVVQCDLSCTIFFRFS